MRTEICGGGDVCVVTVHVCWWDVLGDNGAFSFWGLVCIAQASRVRRGSWGRATLTALSAMVVLVLVVLVVAVVLLVLLLVVVGVVVVAAVLAGCHDGERDLHVDLTHKVHDNVRPLSDSGPRLV